MNDNTPRFSTPAPNTPGLPGCEQGALEPRQVTAMRELFWQNVIREMLTSLSMICALRPSPASIAIPDEDESHDQSTLDPAPVETSFTSTNTDIDPPIETTTHLSAAPTSDPDRTSFDQELFDGRLAIITRRGERIPIADVFPLFACGIETPRERVMSLALECTVFQIRTPLGEVYTLPLHEIATFHALSPEMMRRLSAMARKRQEAETGQSGVQQPFGFAAFTSTSREMAPPPGQTEPEPPTQSANPG